ncbi:hypothetical protein F2P56_014629 [Juglans regia]|uniref:Werner Syndrome-like exonuclease n=2 Tax=Juglans regia TaxID=51240 RepID=A0A2I4ETP4_JUGRE|nr:Werner Syndrome-like exonuclease [Juglans regia]KAF5464558.1 hypothetical protein F2P56_014629 [Juglans regia]
MAMVTSNRSNTTLILNLIAYKSKYSIKFAGKTIETTVTDEASIVDEWVREMLSICGGKAVAVGLGVHEWRPHPICWMSNKSATLQLCIDQKCLIIQLFYLDYIPQSIKSFLMNSNFTFVGIRVAEDIAKLQNGYGLGCRKSEDIRELVKRKWPVRFKRPRLKELALKVVGLYLRKPKHMCMWEARQLTSSQVEYACTDAYASYRIGHKLLHEI